MGYKWYLAKILSQFDLCYGTRIHSSERNLAVLHQPNL
jgi:hypothetical protein